MKIAPGCAIPVVLLLSVLTDGRTCLGAPSLTTVEGIVYNGSGALFDGVANLTCKSFRASDGAQIASQNIVVNVTRGSVRVDLVPTTNALDPVNYSVSFVADGQPQFSQYWAVPPSSIPLSVSDVLVPASGTRLKADQFEFGTQMANRIFASPEGSNGAPLFRAMTARDIPPLPQSSIVNLTADLAAKYGSGSVASLGGVTVTPSADVPSGMFRRFNAAQSSPVLGVQTENSIWAGYFDSLGRINVPGQADGCAAWSKGVLGTTGTECGKATGNANTVQVNGPAGVLTGYDEVTIDPATKQLAVPSLRINGTGVGVIRLASGSEPSGQAGTSTIFSEPGDFLSVKSGNGQRRQIATINGHLGGSQTNLTVVDFALNDHGSLGSQALGFSKPNSTTTGTVLYLLAKLDTSSGQAVLATTADTGVPVWAVLSGAGTTGSAELAEAGHASCIVDGPGSINQYLVVSTTTNGRCRPVTTPKPGDWIVGLLTNSPGAAGQTGLFKVLGFFWRRDVVLPTQQGFLYGDGTGRITADASLLTSASPIAESQLPISTATSYGVVREVRCPAGQFVTKVAGISSCAAPTYPTGGFLRTDGLGNLSSVADVMTNATPVTAAQLPVPTVSSKGAVTEVTCPAGQFINRIAGDSTCATPAAGGSGTVALKTPSWVTPPTPVSNDGNNGTVNACPGGVCTATATGYTYMIPAGQLVGGKRYRITLTGAVATPATSIPTVTMQLRAATSSSGIATGTLLSRSGTLSPAANQTQTGFSMTFLISGTTMASAAAPVYATAQGGAFPSSTVGMGNIQAQPSVLNTSGDLYIGPAILFGAAGNSSTISFYDFIVEELI